LDIGVLGYISILYHKEHPPEVWRMPLGTTVFLLEDGRTTETCSTII
jgi:hypothetical protein